MKKNRLDKNDPQRLFDALSSEEMLDEILRREAYRHQEDKERYPTSVAIFLGFMVGFVLCAILFLGGKAHAADFSSLTQTPVRAIKFEARVEDPKPFTPPPCAGIVWPVRMARCEVVVRF